MNNNVIPLKKEFVRKGIKYVMMERNQKYAIFQQWSQNEDEPSKIVGHELSKILIAKDNKFGKNFIPAHEHICSDEQVGTYAWQFGVGDKEEARLYKRFKEKSEAVKEKAPF